MQCEVTTVAYYWEGVHVQREKVRPGNPDLRPIRISEPGRIHSALRKSPIYIEGKSSKVPTAVPQTHGEDTGQEEHIQLELGHVDESVLPTTADGDHKGLKATDDWIIMKRV